MAQTLSPMTSHARLRAYCVQVESSLEAVPELAARAADWKAMRHEVTAHRALAEDGNDGLAKARAVNRVRDAAWDASYREGSSLAYFEAGKRSDAEPYATLFRVPARKAISLGHAKATEVGRRVLAEARRYVGSPALQDWAERFAAANAALVASGKAMDEAADALDDPRFGKRALVRKLNTLVATTEAFVLTTFPGRSALADAILVPAWARGGGRDSDAADDPDGADDLDGADVTDGADDATPG